MAVKCLHITEQLAVVTAINQHLAVCLHSFGKQGEGALVEYFLIRRVLLLFLLVFLLYIYHLVFSSVSIIEMRNMDSLFEFKIY